MIKDICEKLNFPSEATTEFENTLHKILSDKFYASCFCEAMDDYFVDNGEKYGAILEEISKSIVVHIYTVHMTFLRACSRPLRYMYIQKGISEEIYLDTMMDLKYKLVECHKLYGIWGTFVFGWFRRFFLLERFKLGRLQYERIEFPFFEYKGLLREGDTVYNCHIPSSGPLIYDSVIASLKQAYATFKDELNGGVMPVYCSSWMLYPPTAVLYSDGSNMKRFYDIFDVVEVIEKPDNPDFWRIFYKNFSDETLKSIVPETSLQSAFLTYLKAGNCMGSGKGIFLFDGENIVK